MVGVDGSGRTHRLREIAATVSGAVWWPAGQAVGQPVDGQPANRGAAGRFAGGVSLVIVDDAHRLDAAVLAGLAAACRGGVPMVISRRPTIDRPELAELDEPASADGVELLGALDRDGVARLVASVTGRPVTPEEAETVRTASAGLATVAAAVAAAPSGVVPPVLVARVQRRFATLDDTTVTAARILALRLDLPDHVIGAACGIDPDGLASVLRTLREEGLIAPDGERMIPAMAEAILAVFGGAERRRVHDAIAGALIAAGTDPVAAAGHLRAARAVTTVASVVYREAGERLRFVDPAAALGWFDEAADAGGDLAELAPGRAEAGALLGMPVDVDQFTFGIPAPEEPGVHGSRGGDEGPGGYGSGGGGAGLGGYGPRGGEAGSGGHGVRGGEAGSGGFGARGGEAGSGGHGSRRDGASDGGSRAGGGTYGSRDGEWPRGREGGAFGDGDRSGGGRLALVAGAVAAHQGRASRAAELLLGAPLPGPAMAVPSLIGIGRVAEAQAAAATVAPGPLARFAEGALAAGRPMIALPLLIEAAEAVERGAPPAVLPDTPHAVAAVVAVAAGDVGTAEHLLARARTGRVGGPVADERHRLLLAWARMRAGRYDTALHELRFPPGGELPGRERLLRAALAAGIARRRGDIAGLRDAWIGVEPLLARRAVDLWQLEAVEELAVAAARLRRLNRVAPVIGLLDGIVAGLGRPVTWSVSLEWLRLQTAIATEDVAAAAAVAGRLTAIRGEPDDDGGLDRAVGMADRPRAQCVAAQRWAEVLDGRVDQEAVLAATEDLVAAELPWEASRLAGQAAIRTADGTVARRLLERARELSEPDAEGGAAALTTGSGNLSEREVTVARLVLAGSTHREIGAQLYIAPKTVEHHVARIRGKLGANTRAELLAMLRETLGD